METDVEKMSRSQTKTQSSLTSLALTPSPVNSAARPLAPRQCSCVYLGGSNSAKGLSTFLSQRSCDALLCLSCNLRVVMFDNIAWDESTDYLFLRNNVPDLSRLKGTIILSSSIMNWHLSVFAAKLGPKRGCRAYACQCQWRNVFDTTEVRAEKLQWICRKH